MKRNWRKLLSLVLSVMVILTTAGTPVMAAEKKAAPTTVTNCEASGFWTEVLSLGFEDTAWMDKINSVTVNEIQYTKGTINSFGSDTNLWEIGNATGTFGSYKALKIVSPGTYPMTIAVTADGYEDVTFKVTKDTSSYPYTYTATVVSTPSGEKTYTATAAAATNGTVSLSATEGIQAGATVTVTATPDAGYEVEAVNVNGVSGASVDVQNTEGVYTFTMPSENVTVAATFRETAPVEPGSIDLSQVSMETDFFGNEWHLVFANADGYVAAVTDVKVNGTSWEKSSFKPSAGGKYFIDTENNQIVFSAKDFSGSSDSPVLKSGDSVAITANGYEDLSFKFVVDQNGTISLQPDDGQGDPYELHVKIDGSFEAAIVGQKDYDGISSASVGGASGNKNSAVKVYGAITEKGTEPSESDWEELDHSSQISLNGSKCKVSIVPDTEAGTPENSDSGMEGVYMTLSSDLTLNGTPKDAGTYKISVSITDMQGRTAVSNTLPFRIYTGEETLADRLKVENFRQYESGLYAWDIMEPWAIKNFGSNVDGEENSVRVPAALEAWFGSHESGTYGYLGYDLAWKEVKKGNIPQTLYIPAGCSLTLTNMEILSSVRIVVENGGKLTLSDSVVQGMIEVQSGGTFSMNYDSFNQKFTTGSSICGQLRMEDGSILENAAIYSHINYLANGDLTDRSSAEPVVTTTGNVTVKGQVFIKGDEAGREEGQTALRVKDGTLNPADGAVLVTYGGGGNVQLYAQGGTAIELDNGTITGNGKVVAIGGDVLWGDGGNAVTGNGTISTNEVFLQGATARTSNKATPGKALEDGIKVTGSGRHIADGTLIGNEVTNDPLADLYWTTGVDAVPPLEKFVTTPSTSLFEVTADVDSVIYDGNNQIPTVTVKDGDKELVAGTDYVITYVFGDDATARPFEGAEFVEAGKYVLTITGIGNYTGMSKEIIFNITKDSSDNGNNSGNGDNGNNGINSGKDNNSNAGNNGAVDKGNGSDKTNGNKVSADGKKNSQTQAVTQAKSVKTGDTADLALWMTMLVLSFVAGLSIVQLTKKRER